MSTEPGLERHEYVLQLTDDDMGSMIKWVGDTLYSLKRIAERGTPTTEQQARWQALHDELQRAILEVVERRFAAYEAELAAQREGGDS